MTKHGGGNRGNLYNSGFYANLSSEESTLEGEPVKKPLIPQEIIDEAIEIAKEEARVKAAQKIVVVSEADPLLEYRVSEQGVTTKGDELIAALESGGVDWRKAVEEGVVEVPIVETPNDFVLRDTREKPVSTVETQNIVREESVPYNAPKTTIIEQIVDGPPKNWQDTRLPEASIKRRKNSLRGRFMTDAVREALNSPQAEGIMAAIMKGRRMIEKAPVLIEDLNALSPDGIRYYEQPVEVEMAQVMPENVPIKPTYESMILENLRQKALDDMNRVAVVDIPVETIINDADNPRLAGTLLQDPRVRLGLAGAGGAGLLALIAHNIGRNREERRRAAEAQLNYPMEY